jgi:ribokinase
MSNIPQLVVFGSARIDAFLEVPAHRADVECKLDDKRCVIELPYGAKLPLDSVEFLLGGNGANVAVGTKRLGVASCLVAEVGSGVMGKYAYEELAKEINVDYVSSSEKIAAGFGAVIMYGGERTILSYYPPVTPVFPENIDGAQWCYLTSTGEDFVDYYEKIYEWLRKVDVRVAFNPGGRQISKGVEWLKKYLEVTEILICNREEGETIVGMQETLGHEKELIDALKVYGSKRIVITDGPAGSFAYDGTRYLKLGVFPQEALERTGAGDACSTGILAALIQHKSMDEALLWGTINSASVIKYVGPQPGLIKKQDMPTWLEKAKEVGLEVEEL